MVERGYWVEQPSDHDAIESIFARAGLPLTHPILRFQQVFGGLSYQVRGNGHGWTFDLVHRNEVTSHYAGGRQFALFTTAHRSAQCSFGLGLDAGVFVEADDDYTEKIIEADAIVDELVDLAPHWVFAPLGTFARSDHRVDDAVVRRFNLRLLSEASDAFGQWWKSSEIRLQRTVFFTKEPTICYFLYSRSLHSARAVVEELVQLAFMEAGRTAYYSHPFEPKPLFKG
jgi:hypothetical protein